MYNRNVKNTYIYLHYNEGIKGYDIQNVQIHYES